MEQIDFIQALNKSTKRDYVGRVTEFPKAEAARIAKKYGQEYWDGDRKFGFGGYRYDGRWFPLAQTIAKHYGLKSGDRILDVGCGKGYMLHEFQRAVPGLQIAGIDISTYAIENAKVEVKPFLQCGNATKLPFPDKSFDFVYSNTTLHNLYNYELHDAVKEIERVGKKNKYICVESYRNEEEKANMLYWQLTCESFYTPQEWAWFYKLCGYTGDYGFIYFES